MSTETRRHRVVDSYVPPPAKFSDGRIFVFGEIAVLDAPAEAPVPAATPADAGVAVEAKATEEPPGFDQAAQAQAVEDEEIEYSLAPDGAVLDVDALRAQMEFDPPVTHRLTHPTFDEVTFGSDWSDQDDSPQPHSQSSALATAALVVSLAGFVTGLGFLVGYLMGRSALNRMGYTGWYLWNLTTRRRARVAVVLGAWGSAVLLVAGIVVLVWWFVHTQMPTEILLPGPDAPAVPVAPLDTTTTEATS